jgi:hypothetical protein
VKKTMKMLSQQSQRAGRGSKLALPEYKSELLLNEVKGLA